MPCPGPARDRFRPGSLSPQPDRLLLNGHPLDAVVAIALAVTALTGSATATKEAVPKMITPAATQANVPDALVTRSLGGEQYSPYGKLDS